MSVNLAILMMWNWSISLLTLYKNFMLHPCTNLAKDVLTILCILYSFCLYLLSNIIPSRLSLASVFIYWAILFPLCYHWLLSLFTEQYYSLSVIIGFCLYLLRSTIPSLLSYCCFLLWDGGPVPRAGGCDWPSFSCKPCSLQALVWLCGGQALQGLPYTTPRHCCGRNYKQSALPPPPLHRCVRRTAISLSSQVSWAHYPFPLYTGALGALPSPLPHRWVGRTAISPCTWVDWAQLSLKKVAVKTFIWEHAIAKNPPNSLTARDGQ